MYVMCDLSSVSYTFSPCVQADLDVENVLVLHQSDLTRKRRALKFHRAWQLETVPDATPIHGRRLKTSHFHVCFLFFFEYSKLQRKNASKWDVLCLYKGSSK